MTAPDAVASSTYTELELESQPDIWSRVLELDANLLAPLPQPGERVLAVGCGTSYYMLDAYARLRQRQGIGRTRAAIASELDDRDDVDVVLFLSRSGTTSDLLAVAESLDRSVRSVAITGTRDSPLTAATDDQVFLDFADERSVVQTRFATSALTLLRRHAGDTSVSAAVADARAILASPPQIEPAGHNHVVFLGTGWTVGLAHEAALKLRESAGLWTESYPVLEYRHGPIACAGPTTLVWSLCPVPDDVADAVRATGAQLRVAERDPQAELVEVHRTGVAYAHERGLSTDAPPFLSRSVAD